MANDKINPIEAAAGFAALAVILAVETMFIVSISAQHEIALPFIARVLSHLWFGQ